MKVLFLSPPRGSWSTFGKHFVPNALHAQLASFLREKKYGYSADVDVLDCTASNVSWDEMAQRVKEISPDMVYLGEPIHANGGVAFVPNLHKAMKMVKGTLPGVKTVVGGVVFPAIHRETLQENPHVDFVVVGEGEHTLKELARELEGGKPNLKEIRGLAYRERESTDSIVVTERRPLIEDLDELPLPAYDLFPMESYAGFTYIQPYAEPITSRGCPELCKFCWVWGKYDPRQAGKDMSHWRARSGKKVAEELELLQRYGVKVAFFFDENFNVDRQRVIDICNEIIERKLTIEWACLGLASHFVRDMDLFPLMRKAGCFQALLGIEVSSDEELKWLHKGITINDIKATIQGLRENDIASAGTWMVGLWEDDEKAIKERFAFVDEADPDFSVISVFHPNVGSPFWHQYNRLEAIEEQDLRYWDAQHPVCRTKYLTREELGRLTAWAHREFYSKPERVNRLLNGYSSPYIALKAKNSINNLSDLSNAAEKGALFLEQPASKREATAP